MIQGMIFDIRKFSINDGPGIRTTVFLKGCPLRCWWCHNPESQRLEPELSLLPEKCVGCGFCARACPNGCFVSGAFDRTRCTSCGKCTAECHAGARELIGRPVSVEEVLAEVGKDRIFYETSGGGVTVSGGEPLFQPDFTAALLRGAKKEGFHTCLDTCGYAAWGKIEALLSDVDLLLYDLKETDPARHLEYTGVPLAPILDNLERIDDAGKELILRCPLVPGLNVRDNHADGIAAVAGKLGHLREINLMPYHPLGESKLIQIGREASFHSKFADAADLEPFRRRLGAAVSVPVTFS
ncbi:MAG: glycyl-radical enzyme activating protein [Victivallaceae bacterium]